MGVRDYGMTRLARFAVLLLPFLAGLLLSALPGRAQEGTSSRYAFADTTLLRDTLGLDFSRLFRLADSLGMLPDSLRSVMVRFRFSANRVVQLADSLGVPGDSVGSVLERERFNPLAVRAGRRVNDFSYTSNYNVAQTSSSWQNGSVFSFSNGALYVNNHTDIQLNRFRAGGVTSLQQTRNADTEAGWKLSKNFSLGGLARLSRYLNFDPGALGDEGETKNEFQVSMRSRQQASKSFTSELNVLSGFLDLKNSTLVKRGLSGDVNGRATLRRGTWLLHDLSGQLTGNFAKTRLPSAVTDLSTRDLSQNLRGTLNLWSAAPIGMNVNYTLRNSRIESPSGLDSIVRTVTSQNTLDGTLRLRRDTDRYLNLTEQIGTSSQNTGERDDESFSAQARWAIRGWTFDGQFSNKYSESRVPKRATAGGYSERSHSRHADGVITKALNQQLTAKGSASIDLGSSRYLVTAPPATTPVPRDSYRQSYRIEGIYSQSERLNSGLALDVSLTRSINIPSLSAGSNNDTRTYRGEWRWSYRLLRGLTATQTNTLTADYRFYTFSPDRNDLALDYGTLTTLSAILTPRLQLEISHNGRQQPSGNYRREADGLDSFQKADESRNYTLRSRITYSPSPAFSLNVTPEYLASDRSSSVDGIESPQRKGRTLNFSGGASLNFRLGEKGQLTGDIRRTYRADRTTTFQAGVPSVSPSTATDYWNGSLQLSWRL